MEKRFIVDILEYRENGSLCCSDNGMSYRRYFDSFYDSYRFRDSFKKQFLSESYYNAYVLSCFDDLLKVYLYRISEYESWW